MTRRGLTLIEVLAATVLLTILAAACVPALRRAIAAMEVQEPPFAAAELGKLANLVMAEAERHGLDASSIEGMEIAWPDHPGRPAVVVEPVDEGSGWLRFTCGGLAVHRWAPPPEEPEDEP